MSDAGVITRRGLLAGSAAVAAAASVPAVLAPAVEAVVAAPVSKLKAFAVLELDEWTGSIFFAETEKEALRQAAAVNGEDPDEDGYGYEVRREHWADGYAAAGEVPAGAAAEAGWRFECCGCGRKIDDCEDVGEDDEGNEIVLEALPYDGVLGSMDGAIFCSQPCKDRHDAILARKKAVGAVFIEALKERVVAQFGQVEFVDREHTYVINYPGEVYLVEEAHLSFNFPGQKLGPATYGVRRPQTVRTAGNIWVRPMGPDLPELSCCNGDIPAFNAWIGTEIFQVPAWLKAQEPALG